MTFFVTRKPGDPASDFQYDQRLINTKHLVFLYCECAFFLYQLDPVLSGEQETRSQLSFVPEFMLHARCFTKLTPFDVCLKVIKQQ